MAEEKSVMSNDLFKKNKINQKQSVVDIGTNRSSSVKMQKPKESPINTTNQRTPSNSKMPPTLFKGELNPQYKILSGKGIKLRLLGPINQQIGLKKQPQQQSSNTVPKRNLQSKSSKKQMEQQAIYCKEDVAKPVQVHYTGTKKVPQDMHFSIYLSQVSPKNETTTGMCGQNIFIPPVSEQKINIVNHNPYLTHNVSKKNDIRKIQLDQTGVSPDQEVPVPVPTLFNKNQNVVPQNMSIYLSRPSFLQQKVIQQKSNLRKAVQKFQENNEGPFQMPEVNLTQTQVIELPHQELLESVCMPNNNCFRSRLDR